MDLHTWYSPIEVIISDFLSGLKYCPEMRDQKFVVLHLFKVLRERDSTIWEHYDKFVRNSKEGWITE